MEPNSSQNEELYRAAVGDSKAGYYVPRFNSFDQGQGKVSWHWPAFFVTFFWLLYRRMYGLAIGYLLLLPVVFTLILVVLMMLFGQAVGTILYALFAVLLQFALIPMFANTIYHGHIKRRIANLVARAPTPEAALQRVAGQPATSTAAVAVGVACTFGVTFIMGILAAIAIPAYQDYTIRSQVAEGLMLAAPVKASVAQAYSQSTTWPADLQSVGVDAAPDGKYVTGVEVSDGTILIRYGNAAHAKISGRTLSLQPVEGAEGVVWMCGYSAGTDATQTDIEPKYLPTSCRTTIEVRMIDRQ